MAQPARFQPTRFSVQVRGQGPDVILIPGLTSGRDVWADTVAAVPGYRYHLIQVAGFGGEPARDNGRGPIIDPLADQIVALYRDARAQAAGAGRPFDGRHAGDDGRAAAAGAGRAGDGRRHAAAARRPLRRQRLGLERRWRAASAR